MCGFQRFWPEYGIRSESREIIPVSGKVPGVIAPETSHPGNDPSPAFQAGFLDPRK
jgi:hypothetical protein